MSDPIRINNSSSVASIAGAIAEAVREELNRTLSPAEQQRAVVRRDQAGSVESLPPSATAPETIFQRVSSLSGSRLLRGTSGRLQDSAGSTPLSVSSSGIVSPACGSRRRYPYPTIFSKRSRQTDRQPKVITYSRDILCLPPQLQGRNGYVIIPRGSRRSALTDERSGLLGKIVFQSDWSEERMSDEITHIFATPFGLSPDDIGSGKRLEFIFLQRAGAGASTLCVPSVTSSFEWNGRQVSTLAKSGGVIYILSTQDIPVVSSQKAC